VWDLRWFLLCGTREAGYLKVGWDSRSRKVAFWFVRQSSAMCLAACEIPMLLWRVTKQEQKSRLLSL
jgi:hypothetical protein